MSDINRDNIKAEVAKLLSETTCTGIFPCPVEKIISYLGFSAHLFSPNSRTKDVSGAVDHNNKKIYLNEKDSPQRRLFTAAHEIAHVRLHPNDNHIDYRNLLNSHEIKERESNFFAACLLMPEDDFKKRWHKCNGDIADLSYFFGASKAAISYRAEELGLE